MQIKTRRERGDISLALKDKLKVKLKVYTVVSYGFMLSFSHKRHCRLTVDFESNFSIKISFKILNI